jgi:beta-glucosidase
MHHSLRSVRITVGLAALLVVPLISQTVFGQHTAPTPDQLLSKMTLDEKIGQMTQVDMAALTNKSDVQTYFIGSVLSGGSTDPSDNSAASWSKAVDEFKSWALKTRLKIPLLYGIDAVHGHNNVDGAVIFPHNIGLGATHNPDLVQKAAQATAEEVAGTGIRWTFAPCVAVVQDPRWGRTYESFGDSPDLVSDLSVAAVKGLQNSQWTETSVLACAKHFIGDGGTQNGIDQGNTVCDIDTLWKLYIPPYVATIKSGVGSIMVSYSSWNTNKMHGSKRLLTSLLKEELGFPGFVVSDWAAIDQLTNSYKDAIEMSINAGVDMAMIPYGPGQKNNYVQFNTLLKELVAEGKVPQSRIDDAVKRILTIKCQMGLFSETKTSPKLTGSIGSAEHRKVARECVRQSLVLLKNDHGALPLSKSLKCIVVAGKAADDLGVQCGGWTIDWQGRSGPVTRGGTTILHALQQAAPRGCEVVFSPDGADAKRADLSIVVIGEMPYAEGKGDRKDLSLAKSDLDLVTKAKETGHPVVTVILSGRPMILGSALGASDSIVAAWLPGTEGQGVADVLFGEYKPTGKLPRDWPKTNEQLRSPIHDPLFPRGYGLNYE